MEPWRTPEDGGTMLAEIHSDDIRKTFLEERDMDMVLGPLTAQEAASLCGCDIPELCPGPMAAIDEGDKIRTIYDGSWGRCQCTHSGQYRRTHHSPYSHGLPPRHSLVAGVAKRTGTQEAPLCTLGLAQTG